jgi:hypothetical protein
MRPTQQIPPRRIRDMPSQLRGPLPGTTTEDLDAPAYTRGLTSLHEVQRRQAMRAADQMDADNRTFNQHFWSTMTSEAGAVVSGIGTERLAGWVSRIMGSGRSTGDDNTKSP